MIDLRPFFLLSVVLLSSVDSARVQKAASELNDAFKGRDVNRTIARVEAILARNPSLPRLTRGEILALFENITKADAAKVTQQEAKKAEGTKPQSQEESLMVVLPFNANSEQNKGLEELYTRPPVTRIVGYSTTTPTVQTTTTSTERPKRKKKRKNNTRRKPVNQEIRPVYVDVSRTTTPPPSGDDLQWNPIVVDGGSPSAGKQNANGNIDVPDYMKDTLDTFQNSNNQVFVTPPSQKPTTTQRTPAPTQSSTSLPNISIAAQSLTPELKNLLVSLGLLNPDGTQVSTSVTTTTTTTHSPPPLIQYISINPTVDPASYVVFKPLPLASSRGKNRGNNDETLSEDMRHFLASFGLTGDADGFRSQKSFDSGNRLRKSSTTTTTTTNKPDSSDDPSHMQNDDSGMPDIDTAILSEDMKDVLENIGIMKKSRRKNKGVIFNPAMRTAGLLNQTEEKEKVDKLLSTIKELSAAEKNKSLSAEEVAEQLRNITASLVDETKEESSSELELVEGEESEMNYEGYEPAEEELLKLQNGFVDEDLKDDRIETSDASNVENNSSNELSIESSSFDSNRKRPSLKDSPNPPDPLSIEELHHFVENNKNEVKRQEPKKPTESTDEASTTTESSSASEAPSGDTDMKSSSDSSVSDSSSGDTDMKSSSDSSVSDSSSDSSPSAAGDSSGSEDSTPSQDDLIDSFGGENPPENRPNGLYFLVDWNTFLRVGTDNKTVDLNFSPKVGDPKNFLPVTVP